MKTSKQNIISLLNEHKDILRSFGASRIGLFGSFATESNRDDSDVDLLVEFEPGKKTFKNYTGAYLFLKGILQKNIDFLTPESLSPYIGPHILKSVEYVSLDS